MVTKIHTAAAALAVTAIASGAVVLPSVTAEAATGSGVVWTRAGVPLSVNDAPRLKSNRTGWVHAGQRVKITCQTVGDPVRGPWGTNNLWDYVEGKGYASDAWINTRTNHRLAGVPDCGAVRPGAAAPAPRGPKPSTRPAAPKPAAPKPGADSRPAGSRGPLLPIRQGSGQWTQWSDCGPTSVVVSLIYTGHTPRRWDPSAPRFAITQARADAGAPGKTYTTRHQLTKAINSYPGARAEAVGDYASLKAAVRSGKPVIMGINSGGPDWRKNKGNGQKAYGSHWVVVASYDAKTDEYLVVDPLSMPEANEVHRVKPNDLLAWHNQQQVRAGLGGVIIHS